MPFYRAAIGPLLALVFFVPARGDVILSGAGATFPHPLYRTWFDTFQVQTGIRISYEPVGSGAGIDQILSQRVDFGATDAFLADSDLAKVPDRLLHIPTCVGAVAITYNLPGAPQLQFTPETVTDIYLGKITHWSDRRLRRINPGVDLPDREIVVLHRSESSGTTAILTGYLSAVSSQWREKVGSGKVVRWPTGMGLEGNPGIASFVKKIVGSIGYVEMTYAAAHGLPCAALRNRSGNSIVPTTESVSAAAAVDIPPDSRCELTNTPVPDGYPITAFTYILVYREQAYGGRSRENGEALCKLLWWMIHAGQRHTTEMLYAPLPPPAIERAKQTIRTLTYREEPVACW
ncbi:MAG: phosphate ABC transporter substrate-binding protein PstS [Chitinivibrionales bacterium]|nr:phosphate ABC transporter substrate-binding protein PstS [Chitinivibrionales bacterium]